MKRALRTSQPASEELSEAVRWYEEQRSGLGAEFLDAVAGTIAIIDARPEIGAVVSRAGFTRRVLVLRFPYQVIYHLAASEIVIVAVAHLKRRPGYWKTRIRARPPDG